MECCKKNNYVNSAYFDILLLLHLIKNIFFMRKIWHGVRSAFRAFFGTAQSGNVLAPPAAGLKPVVLRRLKKSHANRLPPEIKAKQSELLGKRAKDRFAFLSDDELFHAAQNPYYILGVARLKESTPAAELATFKAKV